MLICLSRSDNSNRFPYSFFKCGLRRKIKEEEFGFREAVQGDTFQDENRQF